MTADLFTCAPAEITFGAVETLVTTAIAERLQAESLVLEFKKQNEEGNIAKAVAAMANTDGGVVIVGIDESIPRPLVGLPVARHDVIVNSLRARVPDAMPEVIPVALPDAEDRMLLVLRIDADSAVHPVVLDGKVYKRIPGTSIGARRDEIIALCNRPSSLTTRSLVSSLSTLSDVRVWDDAADVQAATELRARASYVLPLRFTSRGFLGSATIAAAEDALCGSPVPERLMTDHTFHREQRQSRWQRRHTSSLRVDLAATSSTAGPDWRPNLDARARVYLRHRVLETTIAVRLMPKPRAPSVAITQVADLHDVLLAACWVAANMGRACITAMGAAPSLQPPALDAALKHIFDRGSLTLAGRTTDHHSGSAPRPDWTLPGRVPDNTSVPALDSLIKDWLHVPLFEFGMIDFEHDLAQLTLPRWAHDT
ncbi:helix-turn-helix domain-containing protein [Desertimonas flava]|uniref:AlbA family DNA-binding domain-containing protein n=1 Tax=Desertimonas flava TaxID=2064846 RepID=UPI0013C51D6B|nr:ATP-binding protein [Desertimonas flava]